MSFPIEDVLRVNLEALKLQLRLLELVGFNMEKAWIELPKEIQKIAISDPERAARLMRVLGLLMEGWTISKQEKPDKKRLEELIKEAEMWLSPQTVEA